MVLLFYEPLLLEDGFKSAAENALLLWGETLSSWAHTTGYAVENT